MAPQFFDIHAHVNDARFTEDRNEILLRMEESRTWGIMVGTDKKSSRDVVDLAESVLSGVYASIGVHPIDDRNETFNQEYFSELAQSKKVVAVGECGLDYSRLEDVYDISFEKKRQKELFEAQIDFALEHDLPLMIHCRDSDKVHADAHRDVLAILREKKDGGAGKLRGNVHFFSQTLHIAEEYVALGFTVSFTGVITFAREYDEVIKGLSLKNIMVETDCPYVAPLPYRGKRNEPAFVIEVVKKIAELRGEEYELVRQTLAENALRAFNLSI